MTKIDPNKMMAQLGKMQEQMAQAQEELKTAFVEHSAGGGAVTVKASGSLEITDITIKPEAIDPDDPEMLQDLLVSAVNGAITAAQALQQQKMMGQLGGLGGLGIPGRSRGNPGAPSLRASGGPSRSGESAVSPEPPRQGLRRRILRPTHPVHV